MAEQEYHQKAMKIINQLEEKNQKLELRVDELTQRIKELEEENEQIRKDNRSKRKVLGFTLHRRKVGKGYLKWYAVKRFGGKQKWVYVGNNPKPAEEKIKAWLKRHGLVFS